jgi:protein arginine kinase activator
MNCQNCQKNPATVHVTEITTNPGAATGAHEIAEQHLCEMCAATLDLPHAGAGKKSMADIWKLLQISAAQTRKKSGPACPDCGMTLDEFRKKGRLGCPRDYEIFGSHIGELLERVHGARTHVGRVPGASQQDLDRLERMTLLRQELESAIRSEAYENAAKLRDELKSIEDGHKA